MSRKFGAQRSARFTTRYKGRLVSALRKLWLMSHEPRNELLAEKERRMVNPNTGRLKKHWPCAKCKEWFMEIKVDHIEPVGKQPSSFLEFGAWLDRLNCGRENLQLLCGPCHDIKSAQERKTKK